MLIFSESKEIIIGGICFSFSKDEGIAAIHILVISKNYQLKGNGSHLINILKKYCLDRNINKIIVCADNNAINFFTKQRFQERKIIPEITFRKICGLYKNVKEMELILLDNYDDKEFHEPRTGMEYEIEEKKDKENSDEKINDENLLNFKMSINNILNKLSSDKIHSNIFRQYNSYAYPSFCLDYDEPIDLITIKNTIFSQKYKMKEEIINDINKAIINIKIYLKDDIQEYQKILISEKCINKLIKNNQEV